MSPSSELAVQLAMCSLIAAASIFWIYKQLKEADGENKDG